MSGLGWIHKLMGWVGLGEEKWTHVHLWCDARPTVTFPAGGHHRPLTGTKLYCMVTEAHVCE